MASTGSAVSHRGTMEGSVIGAVGAEGSQFVASGNLAQNLSEDIQITNVANDNSNTELQQSADTAAECPDPTGHPIPLTPPGSASPGRHGSGAYFV